MNFTHRLKFLQSRWGLALIAAASFLGTTFYMMGKSLPQLTRSAPSKTHNADLQKAGPSWTFHNPEIDQLLDELKKEKANVGLRDKQLSELQVRLQTERGELEDIMKSVKKLQQEFDQQVVRVQEEEVANLKKLAKTYAAMEPASAVVILRELNDDNLVKILVFMKETETALILETLAKKGDPDAKRAANLSEKLRLSTYRSALPKP